MEERYLGAYKILKRIGAGGMSKVYLAAHEDVPNLKVILKVLDDPRMGERFRQEADKLALLDGHPNICRIKHFFSHGEETVIAMEYIDGMTLEEKIKAEGCLTPDESIRIIAEVLDTLTFAHQKKIYHRDIKPSNIMLDSAGNVKIIDFGIAKGDADPNLTMAGTACGTPAYMAPEQFNDSENTDYALVDIYSVGVSLYYTVCGELPFKGDNQFAIRDAKLFAEPPAPRSLRPDIPAALEAAILKAMSREPANRFQSTTEMKAVVEQTGGKVPPASLASTQTIGTPRKKSRIGRLAIGVLLVVLLGYSAYHFWPEPGPPDPPELISPWNETLIDDTYRPELAWQATVDKEGLYELSIAADSLFDSAEIISDLTGAAYQPSQDMVDGDHYWRVRAIGSDGQISDYSPIHVFTIDMPEPATGMLSVSVNRPSDIYVDGSLEMRRATSWEDKLETGRHIVRVENTGSNERVKVDTVDIEADQNLKREFSFTARTTTPVNRPATGRLIVLSLPTGASIFVDGELIEDGQTPHTLTLPSGKRAIKAVLLDGNRSLESSVTISKGTEKRVMFDFEQDSVKFIF